MRKASYVSLQSALAYHGAIPEHVPMTTSVTTRRPERLQTPIGPFLYRHVKRSFFFGYNLNLICAICSVGDHEGKSPELEDRTFCPDRYAMRSNTSRQRRRARAR
jgi:hypothetical protein